MNQNISNREALLVALRRELFGPDPQGQSIDCSLPIVFAEQQLAYGPFRDKNTGEEILQRDRPTKRYGIGLLYPLETPDDVEQSEAGESNAAAGEADHTDLLSNAARQDIETVEQHTRVSAVDTDSDDLDLTPANTYRPSSMGLSFAVRLPPESTLVVHASGGRYSPIDVQIEGVARTWWLRSPVEITAHFTSRSLLVDRRRLLQPDETTPIGVGGLDIGIDVFSRPAPHSNGQLLTVCLVNRKSSSTAVDGLCLFQSHFSVSVIRGGESLACILPYPTVPLAKMDEEEQSLALLYRSAETFAVGHGCSADWYGVTAERTATTVLGECLPTFQTPSITPEILREDGSAIDVSMAALANLKPGTDGFNAIEEVIDRYASWIDARTEEARSLSPGYQPAALVHLEQCMRALDRMRRGLVYLRKTPKALAAFRLANHAMLLQQTHSSRDSRKVVYNEKSVRLTHSTPLRQIDPLNPVGGPRTWRPFQIAFFVMALESTAEHGSPDRDVVELIWFPTGGGKTEAYLGLSAFSMFLRRLRNTASIGMDVLMRYTLRLLTAQQFQRASGLVCAMEYLRRKDPAVLGTTPFSIGIWVGGDTTPNNRADAVTALNALLKNEARAENPFILTKCPWCAAQIGPLDLPRNTPKAVPRVMGYERRGQKVVFRCSDSSCEFSQELPIYIVDEDIYEARPSLVIGTVDKFAMLAWRPEARSLFGIDAAGTRVLPPPTLIIQDELHLISGPLGTMVGLFELVVEQLCTDRRNGIAKPKIVSSTATIRRYREQISALYARGSAALFPPPGLDAADSFFAKYAIGKDGKPEPGRQYVGVHAPGLGSVQTAQVRTFAALLQASAALPPAERDPWWTLLVFFNSLRELGTTVSLFQSDIPDYLKTVKNRTGLDYDQLRHLSKVKELTGRLTNDQIPESIQALEASYSPTMPAVDVCLASSIIEVGIDIDRLSLMSVVGQPKTTSQYIQVTGRVGRKWREQPGLVVTIYGASKPRDRSHFEKFRSYHERLYAQVEPTSVTPFSPPALDRGLHAVMAAYVRQLGTAEQASNPYPMPAELLAELEELLQKRVVIVDAEEQEELMKQFDLRREEWRRWERVTWSSFSQNNDLPLLRVAGSYCSPELKRLSWPTAQSMRTVDAECQIEITTQYITGELRDA